jgi:hypothetical protein
MEAIKFMASEAGKLGGIEMDIADISEVPFFNAPDMEHDKPASVQLLLQQMKEDADAFPGLAGVQLIIDADLSLYFGMA